MTELLFPVVEVTLHAAGDPPDRLYRAYINPKNGIPPGGGLTVTIPWYSQLAATPDPTKSDQHIDWFNGGRVYLIDDADVIDAFFGTEKTPVAPRSGTLTCTRYSGGQVTRTTCEQASLTLYSDPPSNGIATDLPNQNVEYTFVNVRTPAGQRPSSMITMSITTCRTSIPCICRWRSSRSTARPISVISAPTIMSPSCADI